jgi:hypothetical protein
MFRPPAPYDLVKCDGYYGLIASIENGEALIALGNGLTARRPVSEVEQVSFFADRTGDCPAAFAQMIEQVKVQLRYEVREEMQRARRAGVEYDPFGPIDFEEQARSHASGTGTP